MTRRRDRNSWLALALVGAAVCALATGCRSTDSTHLLVGASLGTGDGETIAFMEESDFDRVDLLVGIQTGGANSGPLIGLEYNRAKADTGTGDETWTETYFFVGKRADLPREVHSDRLRVGFDAGILIQDFEREGVMIGGQPVADDLFGFRVGLSLSYDAWRSTDGAPPAPSTEPADDATPVEEEQPPATRELRSGPFLRLVGDITSDEFGSALDSSLQAIGYRLEGGWQLSSPDWSITAAIGKREVSFDESTGLFGGGSPLDGVDASADYVRLGVTFVF